ncbi:MAG: hypothetical protein ACRDMA_03990 [Solirubrobacterales bacterium]
MRDRTIPSRERLASKHQADADPEGAAHRAQGLAGVQIGLMGALQATDVVVVAAQH